MAEIEIQWAHLGELEGVTIDGNPMVDYPVLYLRYDPAWDPDMKDHVHVVPLMAVADIQMTYDLESPHAALEHCLVQHTADTIMSLKDWKKFQKFTGETSNLLKEKWAATQEFLVEEAENIEVTSKKEMSDVMRSLALPGAVRKRVQMMGLRASGEKMALVVEKHRTLMSALEEHIAPHGLKSSADGFQQAAAILDTEMPKIESFHEKLYKIRYSKQVDAVVERREREMRRKKDLDKQKNLPVEKTPVERHSEDQTSDVPSETGPADRPHRKNDRPEGPSK